MTIQVVGGFLYGTHGADVFHGSFWSDTYMMTADDWVTDIIDGGTGQDTVDYSQSDVGVRITLTDPTSSGGETGGAVDASFSYSSYDYMLGRTITLVHSQEVATLTSIENATGSSHDDILIGNSGANVLTGGGGRDVMTGGAGHDTFVFQHASDALPSSNIALRDTITDFVRGDDKIDLSALANETTNHHALTFEAFTGTPGDVMTYFDGQGFSVEVDLNGDKHADFQLQVNSTTLDEMHKPLQASDFLLVH